MPKRWLRFPAVCVLLAAALTWSACKPAPKPDTETIQIIVRAILEQQVKDWNEGKIERFMRAYAQSDTTRFASGGDVFLGWKSVLDRYTKKYPNKAAMGTLSFTGIDVTVLSPDAAVAFGRWQLNRAGDKPSGLFTLLFRSSKDGWRIVHDHTSSATSPPPPG